MNLEPYAVVQRWQLPDAEGQWENILAEYLQGIARRSTTGGKSVIGHIKALATFTDHNYLRISVVAANIPANIEGQVPKDCIELELTVNVLIYGLKRTVIQQIVLETANEFASRRKGAIYTKERNQAGENLNHTSHYDKSKGELL